MAAAQQTTDAPSEKPIHTIVLDTGPIIKNSPSVSTLLSQSERLITVPSIIAEIRDSTTRSRVETTLLPFLELRSPASGSIKFVTEFARRTGDAAVLSAVDLEIAALTYELECELNGGDWRLRRVPGQGRVNGPAPKKEEEKVETKDEGVEEGESTQTEESAAVKAEETSPSTQTEEISTASRPNAETTDLVSKLEKVEIEDNAQPSTEGTGQAAPQDISEEVEASDSAEDSDGGEWITPSNLKRKQAAEKSSSSASAAKSTPKMQVAAITTDNALQNLLLQINLNLVSGSLARISSLRTTLLRCHACFLVHKKPDVQFCQRCGQPALTRVTCTTDAATGQLKVHLKKNMQWTHRGDRYSIPKPVHGSANGKQVGGGKNGWGNGLVLSEDQKEFARAEERRKRDENRKGGLGGMEDDYLPGILTGRREGRQGGRMKVGAGRDVNSRKR